LVRWRKTIISENSDSSTFTDLKGDSEKVYRVLIQNLWGRLAGIVPHLIISSITASQEERPRRVWRRG
jgi:hypothetical protein